MIKIVDVKEKFAEAIIEVARKKEMERITVNDIVAEANSSRRTFYNHFKDKYDLIHWIYRRTIEGIHEDVNSDLSDPDFRGFREHLTRMYTSLAANGDFFRRALKETGQNSFRLFFFEHSCKFATDSIIARCGPEVYTEYIDYSVRYNNYGQVNMCIEWIESGMKKTPEEMAQLHLDNIPIPIREFFVK